MSEEERRIDKERRIYNDRRDHDDPYFIDPENRNGVDRRTEKERRKKPKD